ncbi:BrnT family toxin [Bosea sp. PAMC 26642]|uniref:BrnT family toxin n=1 Tax=Bosea sp. (strain PAMC 26642) TaxID=1792307 RepID=UPI001F2D3022|nr:BrnT family toxin [Bosea sp. PAMC 26642]
MPCPSGSRFCACWRGVRRPDFTPEDVRTDYGEARFITAGLLQGRMVVIVWTPRGDKRRIISMRKANDREQARYQSRLG